MLPKKDMVAYYAERAKEYEKIYDKPERQIEIAELSSLLQNIFASKEVLEIACGTGYWTERIANVAKSVMATDINEPVLEIARSKVFPKFNVSFQAADIFYFATQPYDNLFGGFIWSHIALQQMDTFIDTVKGFVTPGGLMVFIDNNYVEGSSGGITDKDEFGNTYQNRTLENGNTYSIIKNFPSEHTFNKILAGKVENFKLINLKYYWAIVCNTA